MGGLLELLGEGVLAESLAPAALRGATLGLGVGVALGALGLAGGRGLVGGVLTLGSAAGTRLQEWTAGAREELGDLVAEARAERLGHSPAASPTPERHPAPVV